MIRVAWATDIHLNHTSRANLEKFRREVLRSKPDVLLVSGDFAESIYVFPSLDWLQASFQVPLYFCLGNHDFYYDSIRRMRKSCAEYCADQPQLTYLTCSPPIELAPGVGLIGHDGWADGRSADYETSVVNMHDARLIEEFAGLDKLARWTVMKELADESSRWLHATLPSALHRWKHVFLVTHVPPLRQACWYNGAISDRQWAPHFVNQTLGLALLTIMRDYRDHRVTVLCGHTHGEGTTMPLPNVTIYTGRAEYGAPCLARVFELTTKHHRSRS